MIFVTLGTQDTSFKRLLVELDNMISQKIINEEVIVQAGTTQYTSKNMKIFDFISMDEFNDYVRQCSLLITHGGIGSILGAITQGKKVIAVARLTKYGEHENDHQVQIVRKFDGYGYIIGCLDALELKDKYLLLDQFTPKAYTPNNDKFVSMIKTLIEK